MGLYWEGSSWASHVRLVDTSDQDEVPEGGKHGHTEIRFQTLKGAGLAPTNRERF